jgi:hypothetical protein
VVWPVNALEDVVVFSKPVVAALRNVAAKSLISAQLSVLRMSPFRPAEPSVKLPSAGCLVALHVERDAVQGQLGPVHPVGGPPDENPTVIAGDALAGWIDLGFAVDFRACRDNQLPVMPYVLGDETDDRRFDFRRINRDDRFARNHPSRRARKYRTPPFAGRSRDRARWATLRVLWELHC